MELLNLAAAFGGGMLGAAIGPLASFIVCGIAAIAGGAVSLMGGGELISTHIAFGSFLGPHIAFAGGAAASAFAARRGKLSSGMDIITPINKIGDPLVLIVGGAFGLLGALFSLFYTKVCHLGGDISPLLNMDVCALSVVSVGVAARLIIGKSGLFGKYPAGERRRFVSPKKRLLFNAVMGMGFGLCASGVGLYLKSLGVDVSGYPALCFGIGAAGLILMQFGHEYPVCHHILLPAALCALSSGSIVFGTICGGVCAVFGDFILNTFNTHADSHIDAPAFTLFVMTSLVHVIWG